MKTVTATIRQIHVRRISDGSIVKSVDIQNSEVLTVALQRRAERVLTGMMMNADLDNFYFDDSDFDGEPVEEFA